MKLILCRRCQDIVKALPEWRSCSCGKSKARYIDDLHAEYMGPCIPIGLDNNSMLLAIRVRPKTGLGSGFKAFVIPEVCKTFTRIANGRIT